MFPMDTREESRSAAKHRAILEAATTAFLANGYLGTNMDEIATRASVSKRTVYQHFADKERLFAEIVLATTDEIDALVRLVADSLAETDDVAGDLRELARRFLADLMQPQLLRLRRLVIASALPVGSVLDPISSISTSALLPATSIMDWMFLTWAEKVLRLAWMDC